MCSATWREEIHVVNCKKEDETICSIEGCYCMNSRWRLLNTSMSGYPQKRVYGVVHTVCLVDIDICTLQQCKHQAVMLCLANQLQLGSAYITLHRR